MPYLFHAGRCWAGLERIQPDHFQSVDTLESNAHPLDRFQFSVSEEHHAK
jgi:hypothetical protein